MFDRSIENFIAREHVEALIAKSEECSFYGFQWHRKALVVPVSQILSANSLRKRSYYFEEINHPSN